MQTNTPSNRNTMTQYEALKAIEELEQILNNTIDTKGLQMSV
jgi:hypothetical protein